MTVSLHRKDSGEALRIFRENPDGFDLLITDMVMPELRGRQLKDSLLEINPDLKYIFMSGHELDSESPIRVEENEPSLQKPFTQREMAVKVREVLDSRTKGS